MRTLISAAMMLALAACGDAGETDQVLVAQAAAKPVSAPATQAALVDDTSWVENGGLPGCFDPSLSGRPRAVAERLGGVPCEAQNTAQNDDADDGWAGRYEGQFDGGRGFVTISPPTSAGYHRVEVDVVQPGGCSGSATGAGFRPNGNRLRLEIPVNDNQNLCVIDMTRNGSNLRVSENGCGYLHGMSCEFTGSATRVQSQASAQSAVQQSTRWLHGAWVIEGGHCASSEPIILEPDGTYERFAEAGTWSLAGDTLSIRFAEIDPTTGETTGPEQSYSLRVTRVNANEMRFDQRRLRRCSPKGGAEPWHPGERFTVD